MKKKVIFIIIFIILTSGIFVFIANEYLKRLEQNAIETYIKSIQDELQGYLLNTQISQIECQGFIKHICTIKSTNIYNNKINIELNDIKLKIKDITYDNISVAIEIGDIKHNNKNPHLLLLPNRFTYTLNLHKEDSKLGFVTLERSIYFDFNDFDLNAELNLLLREKKFQNKSIFYILKEWFDNTTPSFYEYSINSIKMQLKTKDNKATNTKLANILKEITKDINKGKNTKLALNYFNQIMEGSYKIINGKIDKISLNVSKKHPDIVFFNLLSNQAATKKSLEIIEIINSINETYNINLKIE